MTESSRRSFLAATGAGAVAVGTATAVPAMAAQAATVSSAADAPVLDGLTPNPIVVTVDDPRSGRLSILNGDQEFTVTDSELTDRILRLARAEA